MNPQCPLMMNHARFQECVGSQRIYNRRSSARARDSLTDSRAASEIGQIKSAQRSSAELSRTTGGAPANCAVESHTIAGETKKIVKVAAACVTGEQQVQLEPADANLHPISLQPRTDAFLQRAVGKERVIY